MFEESYFSYLFSFLIKKVTGITQIRKDVIFLIKEANKAPPKK